MRSARYGFCHEKDDGERRYVAMLRVPSTKGAQDALRASTEAKSRTVMFKRDAMMQIALVIGPIAIGLLMAVFAPLVLSLIYGSN